MFPEWIYDLCREESSVTLELASDPTSTPRAIADRLYNPRHGLCERCHGSEKDPRNTHLDLQQAYLCGKWGSKRPSDIFLQIYHDVLCTLDPKPMVGLTSPGLMGSSGVVPLTIIAPTADICRHMANCIVRAEKEVFLATNYWIFSRNSTIITDALKELSIRAGKRESKVIVKIMYDRAQLSHIVNQRLLVYPRVAADIRVKMPSPAEIPNIDLQVMNYHEPVLGTFHSKFMLDNDNLEMMVRLEGPIVDSFYDMAIISWNIKLKPMLPMITSPAAAEKPPSFADHAVKRISEKNPNLNQGSSNESSGREVSRAPVEHGEYSPDIISEAEKVNSSLKPRERESRVECVTRYLNVISRPDITGNAPEWPKGDDMTPYILHPPHDPFPMALVCREPWSALNHGSIYTPQNVAFLSAIRNAKNSIFIQTPDLNADRLLGPILDAVRRGVVVTCYLCLGYNDAGQLLPFQNGINEMISNYLYNSLTSEEEKARLRIYFYVGKDQTKPIHNKFKMRSCHIKLMIIDERIAIQGSGNLDTQSFFHSQESNVLLDSAEVCRSWLDGIRRNQNTGAFGLVSPEDGCWHDPLTGEVAKGSIGADPASSQRQHFMISGELLVYGEKLFHGDSGEPLRRAPSMLRDTDDLAESGFGATPTRGPFSIQ
ncbi:hypothetical protein FQN55_005187 [Onygenales sp. PD_40]|nr:hypothetical protein FQN55_005187 [Onygenales sp. PD_40]